jgi:transposase-like protein/IS1 family transposase
MVHPPDFVRCPNASCPSAASPDPPDFVRHSFLVTKRGKKQRWRCKSCGRTFTRRAGTPYHRLRSSPTAFDLALKLSMEGTSKAAITRSLGVSRATIGRWIARAAASARTFCDTVIRDVEPYEVQADELRSFAPHPEDRSWVWSAIEVWSRLWLSRRIGTRAQKNCLALMRDARSRCRAIDARVLISTDGYAGYPRAVRQAFGPTCVHGVSNKVFRHGAIVRVHHKLVTGHRWQLAEALERSEDSDDLNTAYIERLNLFIRRALVYLHRRTSSVLQSRGNLVDQIDLLRCYYNFVRPHGALRFGREVRTPAQQAGLVTRRLSFRDIFLALRPGRRVGWLLGERRKREWSMVSWSATVNGHLPCVR